MEQQGKYISALDIGTSKVIALIGEVQDDNEIHIVGLGQAPSRGLKAGMVTNIDATAQAIQQAVNEAELMAECEKRIETQQPLIEGKGPFAVAKVV